MPSICTTKTEIDTNTSRSNALALENPFGLFTTQFITDSDKLYPSVKTSTCERRKDFPLPHEISRFNGFSFTAHVRFRLFLLSYLATNLGTLRRRLLEVAGAKQHEQISIYSRNAKKTSSCNVAGVENVCKYVDFNNLVVYALYPYMYQNVINEKETDFMKRRKYHLRITFEKNIKSF